MKRFLIVILVLCFVLVLNSVNATCFLFEGTYVGAAVLNGNESRPLFIVVANNHVSGFFAPENQHAPGGAAINQTDLTIGTYNLSITTDDKILVKYATSDSLNGKAKLIQVMGGSGVFHGYYTNPNTGRDFLNIGEDGGAVINVTAGRDFVFAFGKINSNGQFVQVFPENGPQVDITVSGTTAGVQVITSGGLSSGIFTIEMQRTDISNCITSSSSGDTTSPGETVFFTNFKNALSDLNSAANEFFKIVEGKSPLRKLLRKPIGKIHSSVKRIRNAIKNAPSTVCQLIITDQLANIRNAVDSIKAIFSTEELLKLEPPFKTLQDLVKVDDDGNSVPDICEEENR